MKRWISSTALALLLLAPLAAPSHAAEDEGELLVAYSYSLQHRGAADALELILPLLSSRGAVELQPGGNALVVRDTAGVLEQVRPKLRAFDHPFDPLRLRVQIVRAERRPVESGPGPELPAGLLNRLRELLKYESYSLLAGSEMSIEDGMAVVQELGAEYRIDFRLRHPLSEAKASLEGFRLLRGPENEQTPLIHANLNLDLDKPMVLGLAPSEDSDVALMLVIENVRMQTTELASE
ncbi:MAG: hypothetical protein KJO07_00095 [Deltaproteobacteria bacterium]|nr:hypothetical protein [Deltaproteobacteria bacterium]